MARVHRAAERISTYARYLHPRKSPYTRPITYTLTGAALGTILGVALIIGFANTGTNPAGIPIADPAPDYAATIRAPDPTRDPAQPDVEEVPASQQDILEFSAYMIAAAQHDATAMTVGTDERMLMDLIIGHSQTLECQHSLADQIAAFIAAGNLLHPTDNMSFQTSQCLHSAVQNLPPTHYTDTDTSIRQERIASFLDNYGVANNPANLITAAEPSPQHMLAWRAALEEQRHCHAENETRASRVAQYDDPLEASATLKAAADSLTDCLSQTYTDINRNTTPSPQ